MLRLINDPTCAAMGYGLHNEEDSKDVVVFDFGGGMLDVAVVCINEGVLDV